MKQKTTLCLFLILITGQPVAAQLPGAELTDSIWYYTEPIICGLFLGFTLVGGAIASVIVIYAGVKYLTSADDPPARKTSKDMIVHAMIGIIIILIANFIVATVTQGTFFGCQYWGMWTSI